MSLRGIVKRATGQESMPATTATWTPVGLIGVGLLICPGALGVLMFLLM
jgi:ABC-type nickel/cobalt efflux system permease component RcnA